MNEIEKYSVDWWDRVHEVKDKVESRVTDLVNELTKDVPPDIDEQVRLMITETYRFWR